MKTVPPSVVNGKPVHVTDFVEGKDWCVDLGRVPETRELLFLVYQGEGTQIECRRTVPWQGKELIPPEQDQVLEHVRFPFSYSMHVAPVSDLLQRIDSLFMRCLDLEDEYRFLLASFVMSTWVIDRLPVAPYVALVGPPGSGTTTVLKVLHLLCRRGLLTSDISSAAFYRASDRVTPTLFIDETATAGQQRTLFHLLRSGTTRDVFALRENRSYRTFGAKVVAWPELPDDDALNSRCIIIPIQETLRTDLLRPDSTEIIKDAEWLAPRLFRYRLAKRQMLSIPSIPGVNRLRPRMHDLYESLALAIGEDPIACARLLECLEHQQNVNRDPLPPNQSAVIGALHKQIHAHMEQTTYLNLDLTKEANLILAESGERFRLTWKAVGTVLKNYGFFKKRTKRKWVISLDRAARKRVHELMSRYGVDVPSSCFPSRELEEACEFCKAQHGVHSEDSESNDSTGYPPAAKEAVVNPLEELRSGEKEEEIEDIKCRTAEDFEDEDVGIIEDIEEEDIDRFDNEEEEEDIDRFDNEEEEKDIDRFDED
jgi:hypothetical protein